MAGAKFVAATTLELEDGQRVNARAVGHLLAWQINARASARELLDQPSADETFGRVD